MDKNIKSRERVKKYGEVYTPEKTVNDMLNMLEEENNYAFKDLKYNFLEPACGNGNFLIEILRRKLALVKSISSTEKDFEVNTLIALTNIYGIDILEDNCKESKQRMLDTVSECYKEVFNIDIPTDFLSAINKILDTNIILGNSLTQLKNNGEPLTFTEWNFQNDYFIRKEYKMSDIMADIDNNTPIKEYEPIHYTKIKNIKKGL